MLMIYFLLGIIFFGYLADITDIGRIITCNYAQSNAKKKIN